jgi:glutamate/tyrosine decarboxylase-like PLP-dependent enzyme
LAREWSADEIRRIGYRVADLIADHLTSLPERPAFRPFPDDAAAQLAATPAPAEAVAPDEILRRFSEVVEPYPFGNGHPRFWGWVNSPPAVMGIFADALAAAMNPSCAGGNHAAIHLERQVVGWFRDLLGLPSATMGLLVSGGSMATMTALAVARDKKSGVNVRADGLRAAPAPFAFYMTAEGHSCARKAIELLGFGHASIRAVPVGTDFTMDVAALDAAIAADKAIGITPIAVIATAGTTNTGAIDDLAGVAAVCRRHDVWLHVDAAYGGPAILADEYRSRLAPIAQADSVALDPHKWLFVPVEAGLVLAKDAEAMRAAFSLVPPYIRSRANAGGVYGLPWLSEYGFQQTRGFRALKVWMAMQQFGLAGYKAAIEENIALARYLAGKIDQDPELELMATPELSIVCFRYVHPALAGDAAIAAANRAILERLQLSGEAFVTSTELSGSTVPTRFVLRACIVNYRSTQADIDRLCDAVRAFGRAVVGA